MTSCCTNHDGPHVHGCTVPLGEDVEHQGICVTRGPDTVRPVSPRPRGSLTAAQQRRLTRSREKRDQAEADHRAAVLDVLAEGASFLEVSEFTGHSTRTLQAWKRDAVS